MKHLYRIALILSLVSYKTIISGGGNCFFGSFAGGLTGSVIGNAMSRPRCEYREVRVVEPRPVVIQQTQPVRYAQPPIQRPTYDYEREQQAEDLRQSHLDAARLRKESAYLKTELADTKVRLEQAEATIAECQAALKQLNNNSSQKKMASDSKGR